MRDNASTVQKRQLTRLRVCAPAPIWLLVALHRPHQSSWQQSQSGRRTCLVVPLTGKIVIKLLVCNEACLGGRSKTPSDTRGPFPQRLNVIFGCQSFRDRVTHRLRNRHTTLLSQLANKSIHLFIFRAQSHIGTTLDCQHNHHTAHIKEHKKNMKRSGNTQRPSYAIPPLDFAHSRGRSSAALSARCHRRSG